MSEQRLKQIEHRIKVGCNCYIGETESLGNTIVRFCPLHDNAPKDLQFLINLIKKERCLTSNESD